MSARAKPVTLPLLLLTVVVVAAVATPQEEARQREQAAGWPVDRRLVARGRRRRAAGRRPASGRAAEGVDPAGPAGTGGAPGAAVARLTGVCSALSRPAPPPPPFPVSPISTSTFCPQVWATPTRARTLRDRALKRKELCWSLLMSWGEESPSLDCTPFPRPAPSSPGPSCARSARDHTPAPTRTSRPGPARRDRGPGYRPAHVRVSTGGLGCRAGRAEGAGAAERVAACRRASCSEQGRSSATAHAFGAFAACREETA